MVDEEANLEKLDNIINKYIASKPLLNDKEHGDIKRIFLDYFQTSRSSLSRLFLDDDPKRLAEVGLEPYQVLPPEVYFDSFTDVEKRLEQGIMISSPDLFPSFGVMMYEAFTKKKMFDIPDKYKLIKKLKDEEYIDKKLEDVREDLGSIIKKLMLNGSEKGYKSFDEVAYDLQDVYFNEGDEIKEIEDDLGDYCNLSRIERGEYKKCFRAKNKHDETEVIIKKLRPTDFGLLALTALGYDREKWRKGEFNIGQKVRKLATKVQGVAHILGVRQGKSGNYYIIEEPFETTLADKNIDLKKDFRGIKDVLHQMAAVLKACAEYEVDGKKSPIFHRDMKLGNWGINKRGKSYEIKATDFGCHTSNSISRRDLSSPNTSAPETIVKLLQGFRDQFNLPSDLVSKDALASDITQESNMWSLAAMLYQKSTGKNFYKPLEIPENATEKESLEAIAKHYIGLYRAVHNPEFIKGKLKDIKQRSLRRIAKKLLKTNPKKRYKNYDKLLKDIKNAKSNTVNYLLGLVLATSLSLLAISTQTRDIKRELNKYGLMGDRFYTSELLRNQEKFSEARDELRGASMRLSNVDLSISSNISELASDACKALGKKCPDSLTLDLETQEDIEYKLDSLREMFKNHDDSCKTRLKECTHDISKGLFNKLEKKRCLADSLYDEIKTHNDSCLASLKKCTHDSLTAKKATYDTTIMDYWGNLTYDNLCKVIDSEILDNFKENDLGDKLNFEDYTLEKIPRLLRVFDFDGRRMALKNPVKRLMSSLFDAPEEKQKINAAYLRRVRYFDEIGQKERAKYLYNKFKARDPYFKENDFEGLGKDSDVLAYFRGGEYADSREVRIAWASLTDPREMNFKRKGLDALFNEEHPPEYFYQKAKLISVMDASETALRLAAAYCENIALNHASSKFYKKAFQLGSDLNKILRKRYSYQYRHTSEPIISDLLFKFDKIDSLYDEYDDFKYDALTGPDSTKYDSLFKTGVVDSFVEAKIDSVREANKTLRVK